MNLKCYKSVILPLVVRKAPLIAHGKIARAKQHCQLKNYPFIFHPARRLVDGKPVVGAMGIDCVLRCRRLHWKMTLK
jgi:hypothetical protein